MVGSDTPRRKPLTRHSEVAGIPSVNCTSSTRLLRVRVIEAHDLRKKDIFGTSDPYCQISLYKNNRSTSCLCPTVQTKTIKRNLNPVWNEEFVFRVNAENRLVFQLFDHNRLTRDDFLGIVTISLLHLDIGTEGDGQRRLAKSFMLHPRSPRSQVKGSLFVYLIYLPTTTNVRIQNISEMPATQPTTPASGETASPTSEAAVSPTDAPPSVVEGSTPPVPSSCSADRRGSCEPRGSNSLGVMRDSCSSLAGIVAEDGSSEVIPVEASPLPRGWDERVDQNGRTYYVDHVNKRTQWDRPSCPLPEGWEQKTDSNGRVYYVDHAHHVTTWNHPLAEPSTVRSTQSPPTAASQAEEADSEVPCGEAPSVASPSTPTAGRARSASPRREAAASSADDQVPSTSSTVPRHQPGATSSSSTMLVDSEQAAREMFLSRRQVSLEDTMGGASSYNQAPSGSQGHSRSHRQRTSSSHVDRNNPTPSTSRARPDRLRTSSESTGADRCKAVGGGASGSGGVVVVDDPSEPPLPAGWQIALQNDGRRFFINHNDQTTTWDDPRIKRPAGKEGEPTTLLEEASQFEMRKLGRLPPGWEERVHTDGRLFYINHNNRTTQWEDPRLAQFSSAAIPYSRDYLQKCAYFYSHLRKPKDPQAKVEIQVRRDSVLADSFRVISQIKKPEILMHRLWIEFIGEKGLDYGGLRREFFYCLSKEIFNPYYGLFEFSAADSYTLQINPSSGVANEDHLKYFWFCGIIIGMAIYHKCLIDAFFIRPFYKMMLGRPIHLHDMEAVDAHIYRSLKYILEEDLTDSTSDYTFSVTEERFGEIVEVDLIPNGRTIMVNNQNKKRFVELFIQWRYTDRIKPQMDAFSNGFNKIIDSDSLKVFDAGELELLLCGIQDINVQDWKANTLYKGGYHANHPVIVDFWKIVSTFPKEMQTRLLQFVTGTSRVPVQGFSHLFGSNGPQMFTIECWGEVDCFPRAHTCFNRLDLPPYTPLEVLKCKLIVAIEQSEGFDGVD